MSRRKQIRDDISNAHSFAKQLNSYAQGKLARSNGMLQATSTSLHGMANKLEQELTRNEILTQQLSETETQKLNEAMEYFRCGDGLDEAGLAVEQMMRPFQKTNNSGPGHDAQVAVKIVLNLIKERASEMEVKNDL